MAEEIYKLAIIGSGPAGYTAAIYASRAHLEPIVFEGVTAGGVAGGQLMWTTEIENFPGFPSGIQGPELMQQFRVQAKKFGAQLISADILKADLSQAPFKLETDEGKIYFAQTVIVATGASTRWLGLPAEEQLKGFGVSACATCDAAFFQDKKVVVVGGGDSAAEEALFLTKFATEVTMLVNDPGCKLRASNIMQQRIKENPKIKLVCGSRVIDITDPKLKKVTAVIVKDTLTGEEKTLAADGVFIAIGHKPNTDFFAGQLELDSHGYIKTTAGSKTNIPGIFAAGDVQDPIYRQAVTAAGSGCMAALDAQRYLDGISGVAGN